MGEWEEGVRNHRLAEVLSELREVLKNLGESGENREDLDRISRGSAFLDERFQAVDAELISPTILDGVANPLATVISSLRAYESSRETSHLGQAHAHLDQALSEAGNWPIAQTASDVDALHKSVISFRRSAGQLIRGVQDEAPKTPKGKQTFSRKHAPEPIKLRRRLLRHPRERWKSFSGCANRLRRLLE